MTFSDAVLAHIAESDIKFRTPGCESNDVATRILVWLDSLDNRSALPGPSHVLPFTRGDAVRALASILRDWTHAQTRATGPPNCSATLVSLRPEQTWRSELLALLADEVFACVAVAKRSCL